jgi:hypothetical protein
MTTGGLDAGAGIAPANDYDSPLPAPVQFNAGFSGRCRGP